MPLDQPPTVVSPVVIEAARLPESAAVETLSVIRLDAETLQENPRLDQSLTDTPGVSLFRRSDSLSANPTIQGISLRQIGPSGAGRALVTLDGVPVNDPFGGWVIWSGIPPEMLDSAAIIRGGGSGAYGAGALTGVISLNERTQHGLLADATYGSFNTYRGALVGSTAIGEADVLFAASAEQSDGYTPVRNGGAADVPASLNDYSANGQVATDFAGGRLVLRAGLFRESRNAGLLDNTSKASGEHASVTFAHQPGEGELGYRLQGWVRTSNLGNVFVSVPSDRSTTTIVNDQFETPAIGYGFNAAVRGQMGDNEWELGADARIAHGETHENYNFTSATGPWLRVAGGNSDVEGVYGQWTVIKPMWLFTANVRVDRWANSNAHLVQSDINGKVLLNSPSPDREGTLPTARFGLRHDTGWGFLRGSAYTGFRAPSLNELHRPYRVGNITTNANPDLVPERLAGAEIGIGQDGRNASWSATVFYNRLTDAITNVTIGVNLRQRQNADSIDAWGLEAEGRWALSSTIDLQAAVNYTDAQTAAGLRPAETARLSATAGVNWAVSERLNLSGGLRYEGDRYDDDLNTTLLGDAIVANARAEWMINDTVQGFVSVDNAFDTAVENGFTSGALNYASPRIVSVGITVRR